MNANMSTKDSLAVISLGKDDMRFTKEQQQVIDTRHRNLLVSAAAGSGKTAVLVERIIQMITDSKEPIPVSELLVVTFTNAAAAEMRERIGLAIYKKIEENPQDHYLQQQLTLLPSAHILTLHAFCLRVIRNHFYRIGLDPSFAIGEEADLTLMRHEVLEKVIEDAFESGDTSFLGFADGYASGKSDKGLEDLVMSIYRMSQSHPTPGKWLDASLKRLEFENLADWFESSYVSFIIAEAREHLVYLGQMCNDCQALIDEEVALKPMGETIQLYKEVIGDLLDKSDVPENFFGLLMSISLPRAKSAKRGTDASLVDPVKYLRDMIKEGIKEVATQYGQIYDDQFIEHMHISHGHMEALVCVVKSFAKAYRLKKQEKNMIDFNDIEHYALKILLEDDGTPSDVALEYRSMFHEILADEYQDTNLVQETILTSVSGVPMDEPNIFMVGDIKQSIYKFRLAKPELFANKYRSYSTDEGKYQKIELHKNFRSRKEVVGMTNYLFTQLMSMDVGDVVYDEHAALHQGAVYEMDGPGYGTEVMLVELDDTEASAQEVEARHTAERILNLIHQEPPMMVYDKGEDTLRKVAFKDIVILLRTMSGWSETFMAVMKEYGIPVFSNTSTGYFDTIEVQTLINLLRIIDNPKQDIPLISVLKSPMFKFTGDDLVTIRLTVKQVDFYTALSTYFESVVGTPNALDLKVMAFVESLKRWRGKRNGRTIYELLMSVLDDTSYADYMSLTTGGIQKKSNIDMFLGIAYNYEQTSYKGLFHFISYIENIHRQSIDYGEARLEDEVKNQVTIMSIHGSKGLEFPVVFVGGLAKTFNKMDLRQSVLLHQDYGFGTDRVLVSERQKLPSPTKEVIKGVMEKEMLSEEMRILYVALTRAREKLIFTATVKDLEKSVTKWAQRLRTGEPCLDPMTVRSANCYLDWLMMGTLRHSSAKELLMMTDVDVPSSFELSEISPELTIVSLKASESRGMNSFMQEASLEEERESKLTYEALSDILAWTYPYEQVSNLHLSQSVSELKRMENEVDVDMVATYIGPQIEGPGTRPFFITGEQPLSGAEKGTVFHKVMDHLDFTVDHTKASLTLHIESLVEKHILTAKEAATVYVQGILNLIQSDLGRRIRSAALIGEAFKEKPFVMGIPVAELEETDADDFVMIQGVIDLHFYEGDGLILVDYKTDYAKDIEDDVFIRRYKTQMQYYKRALEQQTDMPVKEVWLYLVGANRAVKVMI